MEPENEHPDDEMVADESPDGRGERPTDPNELAKWIVEQTAGEDHPESADDADASESSGE